MVSQQVLSGTPIYHSPVGTFFLCTQRLCIEDACAIGINSHVVLASAEQFSDVFQAERKIFNGSQIGPQMSNSVKFQDRR